VRGYRTNQLVRDEGWTASLQYQLPIFRNPVGKRNLQFAAFVDHGSASDKRGANPDPSDLTGIGVGFIWNPSPKFQLEFYYADPQDDVPKGGEHSVQDSAYYLRIVSRPVPEVDTTYGRIAARLRALERTQSSQRTPSTQRKSYSLPNIYLINIYSSRCPSVK
jgi:hypothetical protein